MNLDYDRPHLYPKQHAAIFDPRRYSCIEATVKSGKTSGCIVWIIEQAMAGRDGWNYWWVAPVYVQADIAFRRASRAIPRTMRRINITLKTITLLNGAVIWFKSSDHPDTLYGEDVYAAVIDEASRAKEEGWHAVRSTLTATRGPIRIIGNVKGRKSWAYRLARRAEAGEPNMGYHKIIAADAVAAGILDAEEIEDARRQLPDNVFRELYLAEASDDQGNPFGIEAIKKCLRDGLSARPPRVWGWDLAKYHDWTVGIALDDDGAVCRIERFQRPWEETITAIRRETGRTPALVDATGVGDPIMENLQRTSERASLQFAHIEHGRVTAPGSNFSGFKFSASSKQMLMEGLAVAIQSQDVSFPAGVISQELENFEFVYMPSSRMVRYSAPEGFHDDCVCALALSVMHRGHARRPMKIADNVLVRAAQPAPYRVMR